MATLTDDRWGIAREGSFDVYQTPIRFYPWLKVEAGVDPKRRTSEGMIGGLGRRSMLGSRTFVPSSGGRGKLTTQIELDSKGLGYLLDIAMGASSVAAITGGSQQLFHLGVSGQYLPSGTVQVVEVMNDGTEEVLTYTGAHATKLTFEQAVEKVPTLEIEWDASAPITTTAAATPAYPSAPYLFDYDDAAVTQGASLTVPTSTALAVLASAYDEWISWKLTIEQNLDTERVVVGGRKRPLAGRPSITLEGDVEWSDTVLTDYILAGGNFAWQQTWTTAETLGAGHTQLQIAIPQMHLTGDLPKVETGKKRVVPVKGEVTNNGVAQDLYVVYRTTDTAL